MYIGILSVRKLGNQYVQPRTFTFNNAERSVIASSNAEGGIYELPNDVDGELGDSTSDGKRGSGSSGILVAHVRSAYVNGSHTALLQNLPPANQPQLAENLQQLFERNAQIIAQNAQIMAQMHEQNAQMNQQNAQTNQQLAQINETLVQINQRLQTMEDLLPIRLYNTAASLDSPIRYPPAIALDPPLPATKAALRDLPIAQCNTVAGILGLHFVQNATVAQRRQHISDYLGCGMSI
ncbi:hypothetical protein JB92DRAFT_3114164 [Gautieria morchelliformis]|nr:hypothetical protein JB92DRAFT_3114164 [Gautieria morchelliformis]